MNEFILSLGTRQGFRWVLAWSCACSSLKMFVYYPNRFDPFATLNAMALPILLWSAAIEEFLGIGDHSPPTWGTFAISMLLIFTELAAMSVRVVRFAGLL